MSFSQQVKKEIAAHEIDASCCAEAASYGVACFGRYFDARGVVLHTERAYIAQWAKNVYAKADIRGRVYVRGSEASRSYEFAVKDPFEVEKLLVAFGHTGQETTLRIRPENLRCEECLSAFLRAAFLCCGTMVDPKKGYQLEFVHARHSLMGDLCELLRQKGLGPGQAVRKGANVVYLRASEQIEDLLTLMGATRSALEIMNLKVYRDIRNNVNRITNCETANIDKTVSATGQTLRDIETLERHGAFETLPEHLQAAARLRRENPDLSLAELAAASGEPVSKSGLSHRYRKIHELAKRLEPDGAAAGKGDEDAG